MMSKFTFLLLICLVAGFLQNRDRVQEWLSPPLQTNGTEKVVFYATSWCGYCAKTRKFFAENHIAYQELDVETSERGRREYQKLGGGGVPIIVVNDRTVIRGYDPESIKLALNHSREP